VVYLMLFAVWVFVLNDKIHHGPDDESAAPRRTTGEGLLGAAAALAGQGGASLTGAGRDAAGPGR
jgi:hypothetical protein